MKFKPRPSYFDGGGITGEKLVRPAVAFRAPASTGPSRDAVSVETPLTLHAPARSDSLWQNESKLG